MKYFSPHLLDGSVTSAKLALGAVTRSRLSTNTSSQAGNISGPGVVLVIPSAYAFWPDIESKQILIGSITPDNTPAPAAQDTAPKFKIWNKDAILQPYSVAWRNLTP